MTIILTTHYIDEAEEMADRIGVISKGALILAEEKATLMRKLGKRQLTLNLQEPMEAIPAELGAWPLALKAGGSELEYTFDAHSERSDIPSLLRRMADLGIVFKDLQHPPELAGGDLREPGQRPRAMNARAFNRYGVWAIYRFEMARFMRTLLQSLVTPVISTALYFVVFGSAIGSRMSNVDGVSYGAFIVPGLMMLSVFTASISNASFGIYFPKFTGTIYELLSAPISFVEMIIGYVGAAATKSIMLGLIILGTATFFVPVQIRSPGGDGRLPVADGDDLQPVRLRHRRLGEGLRAAAAHPDADRDPADLPGRRLLLDRHAAARLAHGRPVQSRRLSDQRLSMELLRHRRRRRGDEPGDDGRVPAGVAGGGGVDVQDGIPAEELMTSPIASAAARPHLDAYRARLDRRRKEVARLSSWESALGWGRLLVFGSAAVLGWLVFKAGRVEGGWLAVPAAAFLAMVVLHDRVIKARQRAERIAKLYDDGIARSEDRWPETDGRSQRFLDEGHLYAADLDLFGAGSLFERLLGGAHGDGGGDTGGVAQGTRRRRGGAPPPGGGP